MTNILEIPQRIVTGWGSIKDIGHEISSIGINGVIIHSKRLEGTQLIQQIIENVETSRAHITCLSVSTGEPTVEQVEEVLQRVENSACDFVIGIGGGSILDFSKAVAGLMFPNRRPVIDYFYGEKIPHAGVPFIGIPTTSGTGAEVTPNAVLSDGNKAKQSIRDSRWLAKLVIVDPQLTVSSPPNVTAWSGMDALTQAIESYTSTGANILTEPYSLKSAQLIGNSLLKANHHPDDKDARTNLAYGSLLAGIALANARLGIVHGVAHSIGLHYNVPHGLVCGTLLPWAIEYNQEVAEEKYCQLAEAIGIGNRVQDLIEWIKTLNETFEIPYSIKDFGVQKEGIQQIVEESMPSGSLKANPKPTSEKQLQRFLLNQLD